MSAGSSTFIENVQYRSNLANKLKSQIQLIVNKLNRKCGYSALVVLTASDPLSGPKAKGLEIKLRDKN